MTRVQLVMLEFERAYYGRPYYVSGHALWHAIARRVEPDVRRQLRVSHGVFVPGEHGHYPDTHSKDGFKLHFGSSLPAIESYDDLFVFREPVQAWVLASRPRAALNTHSLQTHGGRVIQSHQTVVGLPEERRKRTHTVTWRLQFYVHTTGSSEDAVMPLREDVLDGLRVGGGRNYGLGATTLVETCTVTFAELAFDRLAGADRYAIELVSPYVLSSEQPGADEQSVPWWWEPHGELRRREERLVNGDEEYTVETIDHGQVVEYVGDDPIGTAKNGIRRVGTHAKYGFGEFRVRPWSDVVVEVTEA